jgi:hypothetical protein
MLKYAVKEIINKILYSSNGFSMIGIFNLNVCICLYIHTCTFNWICEYVCTSVCVCAVQTHVLYKINAYIHGIQLLCWAFIQGKYLHGWRSVCVHVVRLDAIPVTSKSREGMHCLGVSKDGVSVVGKYFIKSITLFCDSIRMVEFF